MDGVARKRIHHEHSDRHAWVPANQQYTYFVQYAGSFSGSLLYMKEIVLKKRIILAVAFVFSGWLSAASAQDMIIMKNGNTISAKVMEIYPNEIRYKRFDNLDGPMIIIPSSGVLSINYKNGTIDIINANAAPVHAPALAPAPAAVPPSSRAQAAASTPAPVAVPSTAAQITDQISGASGSFARQNFVQESLLTILNSFPAIPIAGNNLKFLFERERWTATVNGENYLAGNIEVEETDNGFLLKLGQTHIWPGAVGKSVGRIASLIPGGGAASSVLNTASGLAGQAVGAVEMSGPLYILEYITGPAAKLSFLRIEDAKDTSASANRDSSGAAPGASISAQPRTRPTKVTGASSELKGAFGVSIGSSFSAPWFISTFYGSVAASRFSNFDFGFDIGLVSGYEDVSYFSLYPFMHYTFNLPLGKSAEWYAGLGVGYMFASYQSYNGDIDDYYIFAVDFCTGFIFWDKLTLSYTLRTSFDSVNNKISIGYIQRFY
jgi:hypothetical protein